MYVCVYWCVFVYWCVCVVYVCMHLKLSHAAVDLDLAVNPVVVRGPFLGNADAFARQNVADLKGAQPEVIRAIRCSWISFYHNPR